LEYVRFDLSHLDYQELSRGRVQQMFANLLDRGLGLLGPLMIILVVASVGACIAQVGFTITPEKLTPKPEQLNPAQGLSKLFSAAGAVKGLLAIAKILALGIVAYVIVRGRAAVIFNIGQGTLQGAQYLIWSLLLRLMLAMSAVIALIGAIDFLYQRRRYLAGVRMTKDEAKREFKQEEGDPEIKARRRQLAREMLRRKMLAAVPQATVVVTNPTHYAVALQYELGQEGAPVVTAKGKGSFALRIVELAKLHGVMVVERPELARFIYKNVKEFTQIPQALFLAVAELISLVYRLQKRV
jgi:flagellar biosynthesis protein FlhB